MDLEIAPAQRASFLLERKTIRAIQRAFRETSAVNASCHIESPTRDHVQGRPARVTRLSRRYSIDQRATGGTTSANGLERCVHRGRRCVVCEMTRSSPSHATTDSRERHLRQRVRHPVCYRRTPVRGLTNGSQTAKSGFYGWRYSDCPAGRLPMPEVSRHGVQHANVSTVPWTSLNGRFSTRTSRAPRPLSTDLWVDNMMGHRLFYN